MTRLRLAASVFAALIVLSGCSDNFDPKSAPTPAVTTQAPEATSEAPATSQPGPACGDTCDAFDAAVEALSDCYDAKASLCADELTDAYLAGDAVTEALKDSDKVPAQNAVQSIAKAKADADKFTGLECYNEQPSHTKCWLALGQASLSYDLAALQVTPNL